MGFKKTCFECGAKVDILYEGRCENCFKSDFPPISDIKPLNIRYCNQCLKIYIGNSLVEQKEFIERLPNLVKKNLVLNEGYVLNSFEIKNLEIVGVKIGFDVEVDCDLIAKN